MEERLECLLPPIFLDLSNLFALKKGGNELVAESKKL